jgi:glycogen synthase
LLYQGDFPTVQFPQTGLEWKDFGPFEFYGRGNAVKAGLLAASAVVFSGSRMVHAVQSPGAGCGLEGVAASAAPRLHGILAGADYDGWFDARTKEARGRKAGVRKEWLAAMKLKPFEEDGLLAIYPLALSGGGGLDLLLPVLDRLMEFPLRVVVLGAPPRVVAPMLQLLMMRHPGPHRRPLMRCLCLMRSSRATRVFPVQCVPGRCHWPNRCRDFTRSCKTKNRRAIPATVWFFTVMILRRCGTRSVTRCSCAARARGTD